MGYQEITVPTGYHLVCVTFKDIANGDNAFDIQGMEVYKDNAKYSSTGVEIQKMVTTGDGAYDTTRKYNWRTRSGFTGWHKNATPCKDANKVTLYNGEGLSINNTTGGEIKLRIAGEVDLVPYSTEIPTGYSLIGNMTPVDIDLQDMEVYQNGVKYASTGVEIQKMTTDGSGAYDTAKKYNWRTRSGFTGWHKNATPCKDGNAVTIAAGEALSINNTTGNPIILKFKSPVK